MLQNHIRKLFHVLTAVTIRL